MSDRNHPIRPFMEDIEDTAANILKFTAAVTADEFYSDVMLQWSVIRGLEVLGEASKQLLAAQPEAITRFPDLPFKDMYDTRNRLIHGYSTLDAETIWGIVQTDVPPVHRAARAALANWPADLA